MKSDFHPLHTETKFLYLFNIFVAMLRLLYFLLVTMAGIDINAMENLLVSFTVFVILVPLHWVNDASDN